MFAEWHTCVILSSFVNLMNALPVLWFSALQLGHHADSLYVLHTLYERTVLYWYGFTYLVSVLLIFAVIKKMWCMWYWSSSFPPLLIFLELIQHMPERIIALVLNQVECERWWHHLGDLHTDGRREKRWLTGAATATSQLSSLLMPTCYSQLTCFLFKSSLTLLPQLCAIVCLSCPCVIDATSTLCRV